MQNQWWPIVIPLDTLNPGMISRRSFIKHLARIYTGAVLAPHLALSPTRARASSRTGPRSSKRKYGVAVICSPSPSGSSSNTLYRLDLDSKVTTSLAIEANLAHFVYRAGPQEKSCYVIEQNGRKIIEIDLENFEKRKVFSLPAELILYGHAAYHKGLNALLLPASNLADGKDLILALDPIRWKLIKSYDLGTQGKTPHDIALTRDGNRALVITLGSTDKAGRRFGGQINLIDLKNGSQIRSWKINEGMGAPQHFSSWLDGNSIYLTLINQYKKADAKNVPIELLKDNPDEYFKRMAANLGYDPSGYARLSLSKDDIEYFGSPRENKEMRRPLNIFWSRIPELSQFIITDYIQAPGIWVWKANEKSPSAHRKFNGNLSCACLCADGRSVFALSSSGDGYILSIPSLEVVEKFETTIPPAPHPLIV